MMRDRREKQRFAVVKTGAHG